MQILKIRLKNFKSFYSETTINFGDLVGLWRVSGHIGAGKTSIGEAIIYGLYGKVSDKNNGSLISWGQKKALVELWCISRGKNLYIRREINAYGQSPMSVEVDGEPIIFTDKRSAQDQLESEYLDAPRTTMELLCIISFNNFKSFSTLNAKDTKQFLDDVLGFDVLTKYLETTRQIQHEIKTKQIKTNAEAGAIESQITRMENYEFMDGDVDAIKQYVDELKNELAEYTKQAQEQLTPYNTDLLHTQQRLADVVALGKVKKREIDFIKQGKCPTCGAAIDTSHLSIKEAERANLMEQYKELNSHIGDLQAHIAKINSDTSKYTSEKLSLIKSQENELIKLIEQSKMTRFNQDEIVRLKEQLEVLTDKSTQLNQDTMEYEQLWQIFQNQIRRQVLESFIPAINNKISEIAGMLNMKFIPQFDSTFKCTVQLAEDKVPASSLSTGQLKMVDMVIILAIISSILSKVQSNVIFLDELFSNLDPRTRSELITVLRATLPVSSSILIISHQEMDTEMFDGQLKMKLERNENGQDETTMQIINNS